jgi:hypothetical protein
MNLMVDRVVSKMPYLTRAHALEEGQHDPEFWPYLARIANHPEPGMAIDDEMKKAAINELDPTSHRDLKGRWPVLRQKIRYIKGQIEAHAYVNRTGQLGGLADALPGMVTDYSQLSTPAASAYPTGPNLAPGQPAPAGSALTTPAAGGGSDIWGTIGKVLATAGQAAGQIYSTKITTGAQQDIAKIQAQAAQGIALTQAQQQQLAAAKAAAAAGSSNTVLYILLGLFGLGGLVLLFSLLSKRR